MLTKPHSKVHDYFRMQTCGLSPLLSWAMHPTPPSPANIHPAPGRRTGLEQDELSFTLSLNLCGNQHLTSFNHNNPRVTK